MAEVLVVTISAVFWVVADWLLVVVVEAAIVVVSAVAEAVFAAVVFVDSVVFSVAVLLALPTL